MEIKHSNQDIIKEQEYPEGNKKYTIKIRIKIIEIENKRNSRGHSQLPLNNPTSYPQNNKQIILILFTHLLTFLL